QSSQLVSLSTKDIFYPVIEPLINHIRIQPDGKSLADALISVLVKSPLINELKSNIDSLINKVINQQLLPLTKDADSPNFILFDLPVKHNKEITLFQFRIDEEKNKNKMKKPVWTVSINFEFEELGAIQTKISLQDNNISTLFHAEKETTANRINRNIPQLKSNLEIAGFKVTNIDVLENKIQQPRNLPRDIHFLDEKA
ncbi:MAG: flagellar hook-length control protein FliK, partial [Gammaproteobacteria bacterium]|nr:flagellar hook-length control protein FliK [Gammaproteobacteria bacterium]